MLENNRDEDVCRKWDDLVEQDHTYRMSESEYVHYRQNLWISLNKSGNTTEPMRKRSDFNQALSTLNRLHREAGGRQLRPTPYWKYQQRKSSSSSSSTWWQYSKKVNKRGLRSNGATRCLQIFGENLRRMAFLSSFTLSQIDRLQLTAVYCSRRGV